MSDLADVSWTVRINSSAFERPQVEGEFDLRIVLISIFLRVASH